MYYENIHKIDFGIAGLQLKHPSPSNAIGGIKMSKFYPKRHMFTPFPTLSLTFLLRRLLNLQRNKRLHILGPLLSKRPVSEALS